MLRKQHTQTGFTLAELAILLAIVSIIAGSMMLEMVSGSAVKAQEITLTRMQAIEESMLAHWLTTGRIPCPAAGDASLDSAEYGAEAGDPGDCNVNSDELRGPISATCDNWDTGCSVGCTSDCGGIYGTVPVRALNLPDEYALDGWNRRITYVVDQRYTVPRTTPADPALIVTESHVAPISAIEIGRYPALMISHGRSGDRAFPANGSTVANRPLMMTLNDTEMHNVTEGWFNNRFVLQPFRPDLGKDDGRFDQLVRPISLP